jgi:hypothetical protein
MRIDDGTMKAEFVFFDLAGLHDRRLVAVDVDFENASASRLAAMTVRLP